MTDVRVRGYTVPFNKTAKIAGQHERFAPGAFAAMLARAPRNISVTFDSHAADAPKIGSVLGLFEDEFGLGFWADVSSEWAERMARRGFNRASVGNLHIIRSRADFDLGARRETVLEASIGHIAICGDSAVYADTAVWPANLHHQSMRRSDRVGRLANLWTKGIEEAAENRARRTNAKRAQIQAIFAERGSRIAAFREVMKRDPVALAGTAFGHLAFSKYAPRWP